MRNLRNLGHWFQKGPEGSTAPCVCTWDSWNKDIISVYGPSELDTLVTLQRWTPYADGSGGKVTHIASWDAPCPSPDVRCDRVLNIQYSPDNQSTCIVFAGGDIVVVKESPFPEQEKIEILGSVDAGIAAAAWSPDEELLVVLTNAATLLYMSRELESITDTELTQDDLKASKHVSVGWGKAETQFRGKGAKALRDPTMPEKVDQGLPSPYDNGSSTISWRGDGAYVAVNSQQASDRRVIRIYSREGELDGVTEPVNYLEPGLAWRPAGNLIASVQRLHDRIDIVFFERNGLRHGQFSLRLSAEELDTRASMIDLKWNQDSTILAVCLCDAVQLWTMGNYHYYLKQEIFHNIQQPSKLLPSFCWHPEHPLLYSIGHIGYTQKSEYGWRIASGTNIQPFDNGLTSVIDGKILRMTPLKLSNVPPPMSLIEVELPDNAVDVAYFDLPTDTDTSILLAVLDSRNLSIYNWTLETRPLTQPKLLCTSRIDNLLASMNSTKHVITRQISFLDRGMLSLLIDIEDNVGTFIAGISIAEDNLSLVTSKLGSHVKELIPHTVDAVTSSSLWLSEGQLVDPMSRLMIDKANSHTALNLPIQLPSNLQSLVINNLSEGVDVPTITFGLTRDGMLLADKHCIAKDCTSFLISADHLIFTTSQHLLKFVHLNGINDVKDLEVPPDTPEVDERCRAVERGAKLVGVVPSTSALILQMPRGNLETIYPRALVLPVIRRSIQAGKYKKAFMACRNHRVDMNIIHDHAPKKFLENVGVFIEQVKKVENIDLFLSQLKEEDVSTTMYKETLPQAMPLTNGVHTTLDIDLAVSTVTSKVNRICLAFLSALQSRRSTNLQNIITAYVCQNPPALEEGLKEIANIQASAPKDVDRAIEHICFLADVNRLFDTALGMYNLDITLLVAQQSQRDPREYVPFLQKLKEQESLRMRVDIDNHLRRYTKVLYHLYELNDFEALKKHMIRHSLYRQSIEIFRYQEQRLKEIMQSYAEFLESNSQHKDAGIAYEYLNNHRSAAECYRSAHMWREALSCAMLVPFDMENLHSFAVTIADSLVELKDYRSAATIHLEYLQNIETATRLFCKGYHFGDATRLLGLHKRQDLLSSVYDTGLAEGQSTITETLAEMKTQLNAQVPRIRELRIKKAEEPLAFYDADAIGGADVPDNISLAGTDASTAGGTLFTRYTNRTGTVATNATRKTSKRRMKEERKRAQGKKGSVYEEEYLINSVGRLIDRVNSIGEEVERLTVALMRRGMRERARAVEHAMLEVVKLCKEYSPEVFQAPAKDTPQPLTIGKPLGGDAVLWESMEQLRTPREAPPIKSFEKLSFLSIE